MATRPEVAVTISVMLVKIADDRARITRRLEPLANDAVSLLGTTTTEAAADPLDRGRHPLAVIVGDLRLLEIQSAIVADDLRAGLAGRPSPDDPEYALRALSDMGNVRWEQLEMLRRVLPAVSARLLTLTGQTTSGRRLRDVVGELRTLEQYAGQVRASLEDLLGVRVPSIQDRAIGTVGQVVTGTSAA